MADRFPAMDVAQANEECKARSSYVFDNCGRCKQRVGLHCGDCKIQVTGCYCTEEDRFGSSEAVKRTIDRYGEEEAKKRLQAAGLWIPKGSLN